MRRQPDLTIIFLNILSAVGAVAWIQYIESGGGNENAGMLMIAMASLSVMSALVAIYRRRVWIAKGLLKPDEDGTCPLASYSLCHYANRPRGRCFGGACANTEDEEEEAQEVEEGEEEGEEERKQIEDSSQALVPAEGTGATTTSAGGLKKRSKSQRGKKKAD